MDTPSAPTGSGLVLPSRRHFHRLAAATAALGAGTGLAGCQSLGMSGQGSAASGDWFELVRVEHRAADKLFQQVLSADDPAARAQLQMKLADALKRHALEEENALYPALQMAGLRAEPQQLYAEHSQMKVLLAELDMMPKNHPQWMRRAQELRTLVQQHVQEEETRIYPSFRQKLSAEQNAMITAMYRREGAKFNAA